MQLGDGVCLGAGRLIWTPRDHGVVRVSHSNDTRTEGDVGCRQAIGISSAIMALMVVTHDDRERAQRGGMIEKIGSQ